MRGPGPRTTPLANAAARFVALVVVFGAALTAQTPRTLFNTPDYRQDRDRWTDPAYYLHNTARQLTDMQVENRFGQKGDGRDEYDIKSPYPYKDSSEHYQDWLNRAKGGTKHTMVTLPDWDGMWAPRPTWLDSRNVQVSTVAAALTPQYREYLVQQAKAEAEGRGWWASAFCLPEGFVRGLWRVGEFIVRPTQVVIHGDANQETQIRWIHTDGSGHRPPEQQFPQWTGESIGFWDGNALVVHTNQIKGWNATHVLFEWTDQMTAVERYELIGGEMVGEVTLYDPAVFVQPLHAKLRFTRRQGRPIFGTCTDTNGPSSNIFAGPDGVLNEKVKGDPGYWDPNDPRPWAAFFALGERQR